MDISEALQNRALTEGVATVSTVINGDFDDFAKFPSLNSRASTRPRPAPRFPASCA